MSATIVAIIPLYNGARFIRSSLESVLNQERQADEIIVVDDGSTDDGAGAAIVTEIARTDPRVKLLSKSNGGQGSARNFGVESSRSDLIAFLDQDDKWYPHHLRILEQPLLVKSGAPLGWVYSNLDQVNEDGRMICHSFLSTFTKIEHPKRTLKSCLAQDMYVLPGASLIAREAYTSVGGFDPQFVGYEDDDLFLRIFCAGWRGEYIDQPLTVWRVHPLSASYSSSMAISRSRYFEKLKTSFPDEPEMNRYYIRDYISPRFVSNALADLYKAMLAQDRDRIALARSHIKSFSEYLGFPRKDLIRAFTFVATLPPSMWLVRSLPKSIFGQLRTRAKL